MKYIIAFVFLAALLPGVGGNINLVFYITPLRLALLLLPVVYIGEKLFHIRTGKYYLKTSNIMSVMFMLVWFLYSLLTVFWCENLAAWQHGEYFIFIGIWTMLFFDMSNLKEKDYIDILKCAQAAIVVHNVLGWYEVITHNYLFAPQERLAIFRSTRQYYPVTTMLNQNDLALVLIFGICLSIMFMSVSRKTYLKLFHFIILISNISLVMLTDSRLGIVGMIISLLCFAIFMIPRKVKRYIIGIGSALVAISVIVLPHVYLKMAEYLSDIKGLDFANATVSSDAVRLNLIRNGLYYLKETWGFGVGTGNVDYWLQVEPVYYVRGFSNMHNWWVEILTNFGVIIFLLYIIFYISLLYSLYKKNKTTRSFKLKMIYISLLSFMAAYSIASMSSSSNWGKEWLWILWAFVIAVEGAEEQKYNQNVQLVKVTDERVNYE